MELSMRLSHLVLAGALALAALPASAVTITQTGGFAGALPFAATPIVFNRFNAPGQVLQSVTLSFENSGGGSATITAGRFGAVGFVSNAQTVAVIGNGFSLSARGAGPAQGVALGANAVRTYFFSPNSADSETLTGDLSAFLGPGTLSFAFGIVDTSLPLAVGTASTVRDQNFETVITLTYDSIAAVPEPATWGMMIFGFGLAGAALRRRAPAAA
jgi:hypothetical protein